MYASPKASLIRHHTMPLTEKKYHDYFILKFSTARMDKHENHKAVCTGFGILTEIPPRYFATCLYPIHSKFAIFQNAAPGI